MSAGGIIPESGSTIIPAGGGDVQQLKAGEVVSARVVGDLGEGKYNLQFKGRPGVVEVASEVPLPQGRDLDLQVQQGSGRVVLRLVHAVAGTPASAGASDQATVPSPFAIAVDLNQAAAHAASGQPELPVGLVFSDSSVAVHFPDSTVVEGRAQVALPEQIQTPANTGAIVNAAGTQALNAHDAAGLISDTLSEAALIADQVNVAVLLRQGDGRAVGRAALTLPVQSLAALVDSLNEAGQGNVAAAVIDGTVITGSGAAASEVRVMMGDISAQLTLAEGLELAAGRNLRIELGSEAQLTGMLRIAADGIHPFADLVETSLNAAGLMPTEFSRQAAEALLTEGLPISRENVQALMVLAGARQGDERVAMLAAGARLLAHDLPVTPPLAAGMAGILGADQGATAVLARVQALVQEAGAQATAGTGAIVNENLAAARASLESVAVMLGQADTPEQIANFFNTLAREPMGQAVASLENAAGAIIAGQPPLQRIDAAIAALMAAAGTGEAAASEPDAVSVAAGGNQLPGQAAENVTAAAGETAADLAALLSSAGTPARSLAHPGVNPAYLALVPRTAAGGAEIARVMDVVRQVLAAPDNETAQQLVRALANTENRSLVNAVLGRLQAVEQEIMEQTPALRHVRDAITGLRDLGRRFMVYKAENLAGMRQDPNVLVAEVPFRMAEQSGDGRLQVYYRRGGRKGPGRRWSARVVLDLQTTRMGPVVGDMRFFGREVALSLFAADRDTSDYLGSERGQLTAALREKGFMCTPRFRVIPEARDPLPRKGVFADRPVSGGEDWKLDVEA